MAERIEQNEESRASICEVVADAAAHAAALGGAFISGFRKLQESDRTGGAEARLPQLALEDQNRESAETVELKFDLGGKRQDVIISITLPDGGKISRVTEVLPGPDKGFFVFKGYQLPDGTLLEKNIHRNTDGSISVFNKNVDNRNPDRNEQRMTPRQFIEWVKSQQRK